MLKRLLTTLARGAQDRPRPSQTGPGPQNDHFLGPRSPGASKIPADLGQFRLKTPPGDLPKRGPRTPPGTPPGRPRFQGPNQVQTAFFKTPIQPHLDLTVLAKTGPELSKNGQKVTFLGHFGTPDGPKVISLFEPLLNRTLKFKGLSQ